MDAEHKKYRIQDLENEISYHREYLENEREDLKKDIEQRNQYANETNSIAEAIDGFPLDSQEKKQYIELIMSKDEEAIKSFAQRFENNWWAVSFLTFYARTQICYCRQSEKTIKNFNEIIADKEKTIEELDLHIKQLNQELIKLRN